MGVLSEIKEKNNKLTFYYSWDERVIESRNSEQNGRQQHAR